MRLQRRGPTAEENPTWTPCREGSGGELEKHVKQVGSREAQRMEVPFVSGGEDRGPIYGKEVGKAEKCCLNVLRSSSPEGAQGPG